MKKIYTTDCQEWNSESEDSYYMQKSSMDTKTNAKSHNHYYGYRTQHISEFY